MRNITPAEVKNSSLQQLNALCEQLREEIFRTVSMCGGHLSSNLGTVELTVALHRVFDFPRDKIIFDVGHQCYAHKLLSQRAELFHTLRKEGGLSGFPKREESEYDCYGTGNAGTAISAALGFAKARDLNGGQYEVVALVGDGSFHNGLVFEALNSLRILKTRILIVLNDNGMSISPTVGGSHEVFEALRSGNACDDDVRLFERYGLTYMGVVNGNSLEELLPALERAKEELKEGSVLLHVSTKKGLGYPFSENAPTETHGLSPKPAPKREYASALGEELSLLAQRDPRVVAVTAAMTDSLGLRGFFNAFPSRAYDVGICEEHAAVLSASLAAAGMKPYYAIYSTFLQRAFDEIVHDVCGQDLPVVFCIDRAGVTGPDGETHQGIFDLSYLSFIPNLAIGIPANIGEFRAMLRASVDYAAPLAIRYPRAGEEGSDAPIEIGKSEILHSSTSDILLIAAGERCLDLARRLLERAQRSGFSFTLVNLRFLKPLDVELLQTLSQKYIVTLEDNVLCGGLSDAVNRFFLNENRTIANFGYRDCFIPQGEPDSLARKYGLNEEEIWRTLEEFHARG